MENDETKVTKNTINNYSCLLVFYLCTVTLFVVIGFTFDNRTGAVDLLGEGEAYRLVREGHE